MEAVMFESLSEQMKRDEAREFTPRARFVEWTVVAVVAALVFTALYMGIRVFA
jgi:hypothetical protein